MRPCSASSRSLPIIRMSVFIGLPCSTSPSARRRLQSKLKATKKDLTEITLVAKKKLAKLEAMEQERLALASISPPHKLEVLIHVENIMGVKIPIVQLVEQLEEAEKPKSGSFHAKSKRIEETAGVYLCFIKKNSKNLAKNCKRTRISTCM